MPKIEIKPISVNEAFRGKRFKTPAYSKFEKSCLWLLPKMETPKGKLELILHFGFSSKGSDIDNGIKQTTDVLSKKYGFNDNMIYSLIVKKEIVPKGKEFFSFEILPYNE